MVKKVFFAFQTDNEKSSNIINEMLVNLDNKRKIIYINKGDYFKPAHNIRDNIKRDIKNCEIFIADVTPVATFENKKKQIIKKMPNSNVMFELGMFYGYKNKMENVILLCMDYQNKIAIENMPFDITNNYIIKFGKMFREDDIEKAIADTQPIEPCAQQ